MKFNLTPGAKQIAKQDEYADQVKWQTSVPSIRTISAMALLSGLVPTVRFKGLDKLCPYIGLVPTTNSPSDNDRVGSITLTGNWTLRGVQ